MKANLIGLLQIAFVVLKLCDVINWHWALVLLPIEIDIGLSILLAIIYFAIVGIAALKETIDNKKIAKNAIFSCEIRVSPYINIKVLL